MTDHIANNRLSLAFGQVYLRIPLKAAPHIRHADALETEWESLLPAADCDYVLGNPPFIGAKFQTSEQRAAAKAMTAAVMAGASGDDFIAILKEITTRRQAIETKLKEWVPILRIDRIRVLSDMEKLSVVASAIVKVFSAPPEDFSPAEKRALLLPIVERIVPNETGDGALVAWKWETAQNVRTC
jgi:hypothetical protein